MAVVNTLDQTITDLDATPIVLANTRDYGGRVRRVVGTIEIAVADDDLSTFRMVRVHSSWSVHSIKTFQDAITGFTSADIGLYQTAANGGAVLDVDAYASAVNLATADVVGTERAFEARDIANVKQQVFQDAGLVADNDRFLDLTITANTLGATAGTLTMVVEYTDGV